MQMRKVIEALVDRKAYLALKIEGWIGPINTGAYHGTRKEFTALSCAIELAQAELSRRHVAAMNQNELQYVDLT